MSDKKTLWQAKATLSNKSFDMYGCNIQSLKVGPMPILLIQVKPIADFAIIPLWRNIVKLKGMLEAKRTHLRLRTFCVLSKSNNIKC